MRYRIFLYKAKYGPADRINYELRNQFNDKLIGNARYAADELLPFDARTIADRLQVTLGDKAKVVIKYPPEGMNRVAYILVATSYENSESIINPVLTAACENHLAFYDTETGKTFCSDRFVGSGSIKVKLRANQICKSVREKMDANAVYRFRYNNDRDIEIFSRLEQGDRSDDPKIADIMPYSRRNGIFKDKYFKLDENKVCKTITAHMKFDCNMYIHPTQARGLTPREAARIQSYPDDYFFRGAYTKTFMQIGNSVPPLLGYEIAKVMKKYILLLRNQDNQNFVKGN